MNSSALQIGEIAALAGVSVDTVRYYERKKLLPRASRTTGGFRLFPTATADRIMFIKQAQEMGLNLDEIGQLIATRGGADECLSVRNLLQTKLDELNQRLKKMQEFRKILKRQLAACEHEIEIHGESATCPVLITIGNMK
jgi:DNA-binding transcriptional MerR regulator